MQKGIGLAAGKATFMLMIKIRARLCKSRAAEIWEYNLGRRHGKEWSCSGSFLLSYFNHPFRIWAEKIVLDRDRQGNWQGYTGNQKIPIPFLLRTRQGQFHLTESWIFQLQMTIVIPSQTVSTARTTWVHGRVRICYSGRGWRGESFIAVQDDTVTLQNGFISLFDLSFCVCYHQTWFPAKRNFFWFPGNL